MYLVPQVLNLYFTFHYIKMHGKTRAISHTYTPIKTEHYSKNAVKHGYNEYGKNEFANRGVCLIKLLHVTRTKYVK